MVSKFMHDEALAIEQLKALPRDARLHLSHVLRNGLCCIKGAIKCQGRAKARDRLMELERKIEKMGL